MDSAFPIYVTVTVFVHVETLASTGPRNGNMCWLLGGSNYGGACENDVGMKHLILWETVVDRSAGLSK